MKWRYENNPSKCVVIVFKESTTKFKKQKQTLNTWL